MKIYNKIQVKLIECDEKKVIYSAMEEIVLLIGET
jgi:hypothetical protein